jgi:ribosomal protein S18 acetylase RimI-like enzyme
MGRVFVLRADDVTIGTCVCFRSWERPNEVMLLSMGIRPGWRGRGLGQRFVRGVLERLKARGIRSVALLVGKDNRRAIQVYGDVGFQVVGERLVEPDSGDTLMLMRAVLKEDPHLIAIDAYAKPLPANGADTVADQSIPSSPDATSGASSSLDK